MILTVLSFFSYDRQTQAQETRGTHSLFIHLDIQSRITIFPVFFFFQEQGEDALALNPQQLLKSLSPSQTCMEITVDPLPVSAA